MKDVFDTSWLPTEYGSPIYRGHRPRSDAALVSLLSAAGAVVVGKTKTSEFAFRHPSDTRNPLDLERTPGGSSSGSAAAVAARMVPLATGTQTAGSIVRPASYCGVLGFKPTFGVLPLAGALPTSASLDTAGLFARHVDDLELALTAASAAPAGMASARAARPPDGAGEARARTSAPRPRGSASCGSPGTGSIPLRATQSMTTWAPSGAPARSSRRRSCRSPSKRWSTRR